MLITMPTENLYNHTESIVCTWHVSLISPFRAWGCGLKHQCLMPYDALETDGDKSIRLRIGAKLIGLHIEVCFMDVNRQAAGLSHRSLHSFPICFLPLPCSPSQPKNLQIQIRHFCVKEHHFNLQLDSKVFLWIYLVAIASPAVHLAFSRLLACLVS